MHSSDNIYIVYRSNIASAKYIEDLYKLFSKIVFTKTPIYAIMLISVFMRSKLVIILTVRGFLPNYEELSG